MSWKQIAAILAVIVQIGNAVLALGTAVLPPKYGAIIAAVVGVIQSILPRIQGSDASDVK